MVDRYISAGSKKTPEPSIKVNGDTFGRVWRLLQECVCEVSHVKFAHIIHQSLRAGYDGEVLKCLPEKFNVEDAISRFFLAFPPKTHCIFTHNHSHFQALQCTPFTKNQLGTPFSHFESSYLPMIFLLYVIT